MDHQHHKPIADSVLSPRIRQILQITVFLGFGVAVAAFILTLAWSVRYEQGWLELAQQHAPTILGLPMAALASYAIVSSLSFTSGPATFKAFGIEFSGTAGQIILWGICYMIITASIVATWKLTIQ